MSGQPSSADYIRLALGMVLPLALILGAILLIPASAGQWLGITIRSWCLFACAPITALLLSLSLPKGERE